MKSPNSPEFHPTRLNGLTSVAEAAALIEAGLPLSIAGPEAALDALPAGNWIGGTTSYFMTDAGGVVVDADRVFVTDLSGFGEISFASYGADELDRISGNGPDHGFSIAIIPAQSTCHERFALEAGNYPETFLRPTVGWIAGFDLREVGASAKVYDGRGPYKHVDRAVVAYVAQPEAALLAIEIVNPFVPGNGDVITFDAAGFTPATCFANGVATGFADYLALHGLGDGALPLIGDFGGAHLNVSIKSVRSDDGHVELYAPVFPGVEYRFAAPLSDYAGSFRDQLAKHADDGALWSCNCILNFLFGKLENQSIGGTAGPVTFGEIAYQLLNQTMVIVREQ